MTGAFDDRLMTLEIAVDDRKIVYDQRYGISASGIRYTNGNFGEMILRIDNISKETRDYLITKTTNWKPNRTTANISLSVGRASRGTFQLFQGQAIASNPTQPPDIGVIFKSLSQSALLGYVNAFTAPANATVKTICQGVADSASLTLDFQAATNPNIGNYHFTGAIGKQIQRLNELGVRAYVDPAGNTLVVTDVGAARQAAVIEVNSSTGMIGIPEITEVGVRVRMLIDNEVQIGCAVNLKSDRNPAVNGEYVLFQLLFEVESRQPPFYWIMELQPKANAIGLQ